MNHEVSRRYIMLSCMVKRFSKFPISFETRSRYVFVLGLSVQCYIWRCVCKLSVRCLKMKQK